MSSAPAAKLLPGVAAGFVSAYGCWSLLTKDASTKLPHTVLNPAWEKATAELLASMPRQGSDTPIALNPSRLF
ncbi:hypothetical protein CHLNCDRAFT_137822 [Chlorella variabilis]|uniref:Uncharacterized protein n=1 Tax=Chlorella variabilis TaxID=554065 RepID=E1Z4K7_CHLVA|nr:hypothetical protein CHLNCDRAFT_137822 [Chlorella variabilis]EFN59077.1 hypothetical protein CHLNCDRAFT_137822 [Chlorella variabilis]|eukprot:XP_005851179.1 hypothetical protein CHLNCDRAFT_137822 [Chlorella variabilis]